MMPRNHTGPGWSQLLPLLLLTACSQPSPRVFMHGGSPDTADGVRVSPPRTVLADGVAAPVPVGGGGHNHGSAHGQAVVEIPASFGTTTCAVSGDAILEFGTAVIIEHQGQQIYLCCRGCIKDFDKDPVYWMGKIEDLRQDPAHWVDSLAVMTHARMETPADPTPALEPAVPGHEPAEAAVDFDRDIASLFADNCLKCHGPTKQRSGFRLDVREAALLGGAISKAAGQSAIVPGEPSASRLVWMLRAQTDDFARDIYPMPPDGPLDPDAIERIERWIAEGAVWSAETRGPRADP